MQHDTRHTQHATRNTRHTTIANHALFFAPLRNGRKAILVLSFYPGKWTESTAFANQQFCNVSGFSLVRRPFLICYNPIYIHLFEIIIIYSFNIC